MVLHGGGTPFSLYKSVQQEYVGASELMREVGYQRYDGAVTFRRHSRIHRPSQFLEFPVWFIDAGRSDGWCKLTLEAIGPSE